MGSSYTEYYVQLINARTKSTIDDDTGKYIVMTAGTPALATIYSDDQGTAPAYGATNVAGTITNGVIRFFTASSVTSVDLTILTGAGQAVFVEGLTPSQHRVEVNLEKLEQLLIYPYYNYIPTPYVSASITATGSAWGVGLALPANSITKDCWCRTSTLGTAQTINIGISGTPSGLLQGVTAAVTGYHYPLTPEVTGGTATFNRGTLLMATLTNLNRTNLVGAAVTSLVFFNTTATTLAAANGWVYISYDILPV